MPAWIDDVIHHNEEALARSIDSCKIPVCKDAPKSRDELIAIAKQNIDVFPYSAVSPCWFQLYIDGSIAKALESLRSALAAKSSLELHDEKKQHARIAIESLDMALIVTGGQDRRNFINEIFQNLKEVSQPAASDTEDDPYSVEDSRPVKRRRLEDAPATQTLLPSDLAFVPKIKSPIYRLQRPSLSMFEIHAMQKQEPVLLQGVIEHWPALDRWKDSRYWLEQTYSGMRLVPVEVGQSYNDDDWSQRIMPFHQFLDEYIHKGDASGKVGYLAQHDLMTQIPDLRKDIAVPDYCYCEYPSRSAAEEAEEATAPDDPQIHQNIWFGGRTVSPLHHDPYDNILCQVHGAKYVRLYSPKDTGKLYPKSKSEPAPHVRDTSTNSTAIAKVEETDGAESMALGPTQTIDMSNNSAIDIYAMELSPDEDWNERWVGITDVPFVECLLHAGEALYIPKGWWHYVRSISASGISVSFWW